MFSRPERLAARTPKDGVGRYEFLKQLVNEFRTTKSTNAKLQVIANIANFAYDPINYKFLASLKVIDLFLDQLSESNLKLVQFALGGICNIILDPEHQEYLIKSKGINAVINCLFCDDEQSVLSVITTLIFTLESPSVVQYFTERVVDRLKYLSVSSNSRFQNLAQICLQAYSSRCPHQPSSIMMMNFSGKILNSVYRQRCSIFQRYLSVGETFVMDRVFSNNDLHSFGILTGDWNEVHFRDEPDKSLVHGALLNGIVSGAMGSHLPGPGTILVEQVCKFPNPCYIGEKVQIRIEVVSVRKIIECQFSCNVGDKIVLHGKAKVIKRKQ